MQKRFSTQPFEDIAEYVKRDIANLALGNSDNHGRNTAMGKYEDGSIGLTPLYDFAPMKLAPETVMRSTNWECMRSLHRQANPDWRVVCDTIFPGGDEADRLMQTLIEFGQVLEHAQIRRGARSRSEHRARHARLRADLPGPGDRAGTQAKDDLIWPIGKSRNRKKFEASGEGWPNVRAPVNSVFRLRSRRYEPASG